MAVEWTKHADVGQTDEEMGWSVKNWTRIEVVASKAGVRLLCARRLARRQEFLEEGTVGFA